MLKTIAMRKLTREEAEAMPVRPDAKTSWFRGVFFGMQVGDIVLIEAHEWKQQRAPITVIKSMPGVNGRTWDCKLIVGRKGWIVERLK